jgi:hypothetical protein
LFTQDASVSKGKKRKRKPALVKAEGVGGGDGGGLANTSQVVGFCVWFFFFEGGRRRLSIWWGHRKYLAGIFIFIFKNKIA